MKSVNRIVFGVILAICSFGVAVYYTSCSKDGCKGVTCLNGSSCSGGICGPCSNGVGGNNCQIIYRELYANTYSGTATYNVSVPDTSYGAHSDSSGSLIFSYGADTTYTLMTLKWLSNGVQVFSTPITLTNNLPTGSNFTIDSVSANGYNYSGSGSVNGNLASLTLTQKQTGSPVVVITLNSFVKQ